jgi:hypothetical protein
VSQQIKPESAEGAVLCAAIDGDDEEVIARLADFNARELDELIRACEVVKSWAYDELRAKQRARRHLSAVSDQ